MVGWLSRNTTMLWVRRAEVYRFDFSRSIHPRSIKLWTAKRAMNMPFLQACELALGLGPKRRNDLLIIAEDVWCGRVSIPSDVAEFLSPTELQQVLHSDAEQQSEIYASHSQLVCQPLDASLVIGHDQITERKWRIIQIDNDEIAQLAKLAATHGQMLIAVSHPEACNAHDMESCVTPDSLKQEAVACKQRMMRDLTSQAIVCRNMSDISDRRRQLVLASIVSAATVAVGVAADQYLMFQTNRAQAAVQRFEISRKESEQHKSQLTKLEKQIESLHAEIVKSTEQQHRLSESLSESQLILHSLQERWSTLVDGLSEAAHPDVWVQKISMQDQHLVVSGLASKMHSISRWISHVDQRVQAMGWHGQLSRTKILDNKLIEYQVTFTWNHNSLRQAQQSAQRSIDQPQRVH